MISIVVPIYNEENYILNFLEYIKNNCNVKYELLLVDGGSTDNTINIINYFISNNNSNEIILLNNKKKYVSYALNKAIKNSIFDIIIRMDVHTLYSNNYFNSILSTFTETNADIVGGPTDVFFNNRIQESIGYVINTIFGMGGSLVHDMNYNGFTNSVTFGAFKKYVFENNYFDTELIRNQDDEFFSRCYYKGFKIYQSSNIKLYYSPRRNYYGLFKQYFEYGKYKPLAISKVKGSFKIRQLAPSILVFFIGFSILICKYFLIFYLLPLIFYSFINNKNIIVKILNLFTYSIIHFSYGIGFIIGIAKILKN